MRSVPYQSRKTSFASPKLFLLIIVLLVLYGAVAFSQTNVYINPLNISDPLEDGSLLHPYDSWSDIAVQDNHNYLQLRGTADTIGSHIHLYQNTNIKFGAYGPGNILPNLTFDNGGTGSELFDIGASHNIAIDSLHLSGEPCFPDMIIKVAGDWQSSGWDTDGISVTNCEIHHGQWNFFIIPGNTTFRNITILNCEIHHSYDDGLFIKYGDLVEVGYCNIHHSNQKFFDDPVGAGGDGVQFHGTKTAHVHHCTIDRGDTGNKFCIIYNESNGYTNGWVTIENNILTTPNPSGNGGAGIFVKQCPGAIIRYNEIKSDPVNGGLVGIYAQNDTLLCYHNIFKELPEGIMSGNTDYTEVNNNVFYHNEGMDVNGNGGGYIGVKNNIFFFAPGKTTQSVQNMYVTDFDNDNNVFNYQYSQMLSGVSFGTNSLVEDPQFVENGANFRLNESSPCINIGVDLNIPIDYDSTLIPQGVGPEIGPFEYVEGTSTNSAPEIEDQDFQIDENTSDGQPVDTVVANDPDAGQILTFSIISGNIGNTFAINSTNGELTVVSNTLLDFETNPAFSITVQVQDNGAGYLINQATITVNLNDINESPNISTASFSVNENSLNGTNIGTVSASDPDNGQTLSFSIVGGNTSGAFQIGESSGLITIANNNILDFESNPIFSLLVQVQDNGPGNLTNQANITVNILDVNDAPVIGNQGFAIDENSGTGQQVGTVSAFDEDSGQSLSFSIVSGNTNGAFQISNTGIITVANTSVLDFETTSVFSLMVEVEDNGAGNLTDQATITVNINDINENPDINNQFFSIDEGIPNGELVGVVVATDPDAGQSLTFTVTGGNIDNAFQIHPTTGTIMVTNSNAIDIDINPVFYLSVQAQDNGAGNLTDVATITVSLLDVNEMPNIANQNFMVDENSVNGDQLGVVVASDPDAGQTLTYSIVSGNSNNAFQIGSASGVLSVANGSTLNFEVMPVFYLVVQVQDNGPGNLTNQADITVDLLDVNDAPLIVNQDFAIDENTDLGQEVGVVAASDEDSGQSLSFSIISGNTDAAFQISPTGIITVANASALDFETTSVFSLIVEVEDNGIGNLTDQATVTIQLNDVNESPSMANQDLYGLVDIEGALFDFQSIGTVLFSDPDIGQTHTFTIIEGNETDIFEIETSSGGLALIAPNQLFQGLNKFVLTVEVYDNTTEQYSATAFITVYIGLMVIPEDFSNSGEDLLDIADNSLGINCSIYPNPASSSLFVDVDRVIDKKLIIGVYNVKGGLIFQKEYSGNSINLVNEYDVSTFGKGVYIVNIINGDKKIFRKFVKQ